MQGKFHVTVYVETHTNELSCHDFSQPLKMLSVLETYFFRAGKDWTDDMENGTIWQKKRTNHTVQKPTTATSAAQGRMVRWSKEKRLAHLKKSRPLLSAVEMITRGIGVEAFC